MPLTSGLWLAGGMAAARACTRATTLAAGCHVFPSGAALGPILAALCIPSSWTLCAHPPCSEQSARGAAWLCSGCSTQPKPSSATLRRGFTHTPFPQCRSWAAARLWGSQGLCPQQLCCKQPSFSPTTKSIKLQTVKKKKKVVINGQMSPVDPRRSPQCCVRGCNPPLNWLLLPSQAL